MAKRATARKGTTDHLGMAVTARTTDKPYFAPPDHAELNALRQDPRGALVESHAGMRDGDNIAWRATDLGMQVHANGGAPQQPAAWGSGPANPPAQTPVQPPNPPAPVPQTMSFDSGIAIPAPRRGGKGSPVYGFEQMNVGQSFFIAATGDNPNPAKRIASTVSSASKRLAPKNYVVRSVDETAQGRGKGARVWRTE